MGWPIKFPSTIYGICCKRSGRVYIGRTYRLEARIKEHFYELRKRRKTCYKDGRHTMSEMQKDYDKYGEESFQVYIIEDNVPPELVQEREAYWIEKYKADDVRYGYNRLNEKHDLPIPKIGLPPTRVYSEKLAEQEKAEEAVSEIISERKKEE